MIHVELKAQTEATLNELAAESHVFPDFIPYQAIESLLEDRKDCLAGMHSLANPQDTILQEEMKRRSDLAN